jgi:hypothetical protein
MDTKSRIVPGVAADEAPARRTLREQIARLEGDLGDLVLSGWPGPGAIAAADDASTGMTAARDGAAVLSLAQLERTRDALAARAAAVRQRLDAEGERHEYARRAREEMLQEPHRHRMARVTNAAVGEPGCRDWHVRPRFGLLGMLAGWWRVVVSSGCPLPRGASAPSLR